MTIIANVLKGQLYPFDHCHVLKVHKRKNTSHNFQAVYEYIKTRTATTAKKNPNNNNNKKHTLKQNKNPTTNKKMGGDDNNRKQNNSKQTNQIRIIIKEQKKTILQNEYFDVSACSPTEFYQRRCQYQRA